MNTLDTEIAAFESMRAQLEDNYFGQWVLIKGDQLIDVKDDFDAISYEALKKYGRGPYLIRQVGTEKISIPRRLTYMHRQISCQ